MRKAETQLLKKPGYLTVELQQEGLPPDMGFGIMVVSDSGPTGCVTCICVYQRRHGA
jgi:hypothetical protein